MADNIIVIGHKNPDTDSICSAIAYANLKNAMEGGGFSAGRAGDLSEETRFVVKRFDAEVPEFIEDAAGKKIILVDHNEKTQCVDGHDDAQILEIIDHHRIADIQTPDPILFRNQPVGCTCTIITQMYHEAGVEIQPNIAGLLLCAILSDTLALQSPTCTEYDERTVKELAEIAGVDYEEVADEMFAAGENLDGKTAEEVFYQDFKVFTGGDETRFGVGQASFMSQSNLEKAKEMLVDYLPETMAKDDTKMVFFMLTSVRGQASHMIYAGEGAEELLKKSFDCDVDASGRCILLEGVVSRKKQLIPVVMENIG